MYLPVDILSKLLYYTNMTTILLTKDRIFADTAATVKATGRIFHVVKIWKCGDRLVTGTGSFSVVKKFRSGWHRFMLETLGFTICELNFKKDVKNESTVIILVSEFDTVVYNVRYKQSIEDRYGVRTCIVYKHRKTIHKFVCGTGQWLASGSGLNDAKKYMQRKGSDRAMKAGKVGPTCRKAIQYAASKDNGTSKYVLDVDIPRETFFGATLRAFMLFINGEAKVEIVP